MAGVLRHLGLPLNGGSHAHLLRRIAHLGIDTSHFLGRAHARGTASRPHRLPADLLVERPADARRQAPTTLRRALVQTGRAYRCATCGIGAEWNSRPITLQVDHIDGRFWDCRPHNLRFLCPNCHSQTPTYAGRNRPRQTTPLIRVNSAGDPVEPATPRTDLTETARVEILRRVEARSLGPTEAGRLLGCRRNHVYTLLRRLRDYGSTEPPPRQRRQSATELSAIVAFAAAHPRLSPRKVAAALRSRSPDPITVSAATVENVLREAGLSSWANHAGAGRAATEQRAAKQPDAEQQPAA
ncbi:HNH endonuclease [Actinoplanes sp. DH11]|uniref:HNH endonuclease signature motif containing protein n=1 Tax=Actinoplanes sp. DH11 TaxID=2857011 RepID=UPI001E5611E5|nr:HNH endonuclease [Actinoplanes sp. DH11]